jgi:plasmid maintenance system antidote protein VapI
MGRFLCPAGQALKDWLDEAAISPKQFADLLEVPRPSVWRWMVGAVAPSIDHAARIELWTGIPARMWASCAELRSGESSEVAA